MIWNEKDDYYYIRPFAEKVQRICSQEIPIPKWLGRILFFFRSTIRPYFKPKEKSQAFWLDSRGNPLGIVCLFQLIYLEFKTMTIWISQYVESIFPDKYITPIDFRRILASLIFQKKLHEETSF